MLNDVRMQNAADVAANKHLVVTNQINRKLFLKNLKTELKKSVDLLEFRSREVTLSLFLHSQNLSWLSQIFFADSAP